MGCATTALGTFRGVELPDSALGFFAACGPGCADESDGSRGAKEIASVKFFEFTHIVKSFFSGNSQPLKLKHESQ